MIVRFATVLLVAGLLFVALGLLLAEGAAIWQLLSRNETPANSHAVWLGAILYTSLAGFHFGLHQKMQYAVKPFGEKSQQPDFRLDNDRLLPLPDPPPVGLNFQSFYAEKTPAFMAQIPGHRVKSPFHQLRKRNGVQPEPVGPLPGLEPVIEPIDGQAPAIPGQSRL